MFPLNFSGRAVPALFLLILISTSLSAADYFWVGGSGNWSDISHWATTSGGAFTHAQAPTSNDDVFFDANSFSGPLDMVRLNNDVNFCRSMSWAGATGNPVLLGSRGVTLNVFGSLELIDAMDYRFDGTVVFTGMESNTVDFRGNTAGYVLQFAGMGAWELAGDVAVDSILLFDEGTLRTSGRAVTTGYFRSDGDAVRTLDLGASTITITANTWRPFPNSSPVFNSQPLWIDARNLTLTSGTSTIVLTGTQVDFFLEGPGTLAFNELIFSAPSGNSTIRQWADLNGFEMEPAVSFTRLNLLHGILLEGGFTADELELHGGQEYQFQAGETFVINNLIATGDCSRTVGMVGTEAGSPAIFSSAATITADFISIREISATGTGSFTGNNAIDLGGNSGWVLNDRPNERLFWVGQTGDWDNPNNWSFTSGGPAAGCVPSLADDVFFDANSFSAPGQIVTVNVDNANSRSMDWSAASNNPVFAGPERSRVQIAGSLAFTENMDHTFEGPYIFSSTQTDNTISSAGQHFNYNILFEGGGWTLQDSLFVYYEIQLNSGELFTNDQAVEANFLIANTTQPRRLELGNSHITIFSRQDSFFYCEMLLRTGPELDFDAGTSTIDFRGGGNGFLTSFGLGPIAFNAVNFYLAFGRFNNFIFDAGNITATADSVSFFSSGFINGYDEFNYLFLQPGNRYEISPEERLEVGELVASGECGEGMTAISSNQAGETARIFLPDGQMYDRLFLKDIAVMDGAPVVATNSIDYGGNSGWDITGSDSRTLFWVGGEGDWFDVNHWSATSGGPGGECIPTLLDDVFFDENSSPDPFFFVQNGTDRSTNSHDITWTETFTDRCEFQSLRVWVAGSFTNSGNLGYNTAHTHFFGTENHDIRMGSARFHEFVFEQRGTYSFLEDFTGSFISHKTGTINFTDVTGDLQFMTAVRSVDPKFVDLGSSHLRLSYNYDGFSGAISIYSDANLTIEPGTSLIELTGTGGAIRSNSGATFNNILFSNPAGNGLIIQDNFVTGNVVASTVEFFGNGRLDLALITDTLLFAPGKSYTFKADAEQTINSYWQTIGNNCTPIALQSTINGTQARAQVPATGKIIADFVQMRNITGVGGADFLAGARSTDIGNSNVNWLFETAPQFQTVGFLGQDRAICEDEDIVLDAFNFSPGEQYRWQDGSTDTTFTTGQPGTYSVEVTFQNNCVIRDTIVVLDAQVFEVNLPDDPTICQGDTIVLAADAGLNSAGYLWQDGSTEPTLSAFASGEYKVTVDLGGCVKSDSTVLTVIPSPTVDLGDNRVFECAGEDFSLTATVIADNFMWQDGSTSTTFTGNQPGVYSLEASNGQCVVRDSVEVVYLTPNAVNLGNDSTLCVADNLVLDAGNPGHGYRWQDGSTSQTFTASTTGQYVVTIDSAGCTSSDTINLVFPNFDNLDVEDGYEICAGETFSLTSQVPADAIRWSNGQTGPNFSTSTGGNFSAEFDFGPCTLTKDFIVNFLPPPVVDLGPDVTACAGIPVVLDAVLSGVWQDGTTAPTFTTLTAGQFKIVVTDGPCVVADSVNVDFLAAPDFSLGDDQTACEGDQLSVSVSPANFGLVTWDDGTMDETRTFTESGIRFVDVEDANGCIARDSVTLTFNAPPILDLGPDTTVCDDEPFALMPIAGPGTLLWPDGSNEANYLVSSPGTVRVFLQDDFCRVADTIAVAFQSCINFAAYMPTAFSPNFDGINDEFGLMYNERVEILEYTMEVFDRWGSPVFRSESVDDRWDGTRNGEALGIGVYVYAIEVTYRDERETGSRVVAGDVMLVR